MPPRDRSSYIYYCQNCDRGFGNRFGNELAAEAERLYQEHLDSHIKVCILKMIIDKMTLFKNFKIIIIFFQCPDCAYVAAAPLVEHHYEAVIYYLFIFFGNHFQRLISSSEF